MTEQAIRALAGRTGAPLVAILWGRDARTLVPLLDGVPCVESAHPSPYSAASGFFGSRPFSRASQLLGCSGAPSRSTGSYREPSTSEHPESLLGNFC